MGQKPRSRVSENGAPAQAGAHKKTQRPRMKTLLRTAPAQVRLAPPDRQSSASPQGGLAARAYPPRSHHNSRSSPFNQHPRRGSPRRALPALLRASLLSALLAQHLSRGAASLRRWWR